MWGWLPGTTGYCGETSFQMAGIFNGQWTSSEIIRNYGGGSQILIGENDQKVAKSLGLLYETFNGSSDKQYVDFFSQNISKG